MEVGFMYPWPSRQEPPLAGYPKRGDLIQGRFDQQFKRIFFNNLPVNQALGFIDGNGEVNAFEGVVKYRRGLYAIGDCIFDSHKADAPQATSDDLNASTYFAMRDVDPWKIRPTTMDPSKGLMKLQFVNLNTDPPGAAGVNYPGLDRILSLKSDGTVGTVDPFFMWED